MKYSEYRISTSNERVRCTTQLAKLSFNHSIGRTHSFSTLFFLFPSRAEAPSAENQIPPSGKK